MVHMLNRVCFRILYQRVPYRKGPSFKNLRDPFEEIFSFIHPQMKYFLNDLRVGKYIVCGEAITDGMVVTSDCFGTIVENDCKYCNSRKNV